MTLVAQLNARDLFNSLGEESEQEQRESIVVASPGLQGLIQGYGEYRRHNSSSRAIERVSESRIRDFFLPEKYTAHDVTAFSVMVPHLPRFDNLETAHYLNAAINSCPEREITIVTSDFPEPLNSVAHNTNKSITIKGNVKTVGYGMEGGSIKVHGNVLLMHLLHTLDSKEGVGPFMKSGEIVIEGNVTGYVGSFMKRGRITVNGKIHDLSKVGHRMSRGRIYHNGELIKINGREPRWYDQLFRR